VVSVVFMIGVLNLVMGFCLAVMLERPTVIYVPRVRFPFRKTKNHTDSEIQRASEDEAVDDSLSPPTGVRIEQIPQKWVEMLSDSEIEANSFVEASVQVLKLEVGSYVDHLQELEDAIRQVIAQNEGDRLTSKLQEMIALNEEWSMSQCEAVRVLTENRGEFGEYAAMGEILESLLLDQVPKIETGCRELQALDGAAMESQDTITAVIGQFVGLAHELRDTIQDSLVTIFCREDRLDDFDRSQQMDVMTGLFNRLGTELVFRNWWREDSARMRLVSVALVDVDRFDEVNRRFGSRVGDRVLGTLGRLLEQLVDKESGLDRAFRFAGQRFLLFFGDTGPRSAMNSLEEIRQTLEESTFVFGAKEFTLTVSAGVVEVEASEGTPELYQRLTKLVDVAKKGGRNCTSVDDGSGGVTVPAKDVQVPGRVIKID